MSASLVPYTNRGARAASYCDRCKRGFKSEYAINEHIRDSRRHWECPTCGHDADGWDALLDHCRETDCRNVCQACDDGAGEHFAYDSFEYRQHVDDYNVCVACEYHFGTPDELEEHLLEWHDIDSEQSEDDTEDGDEDDTEECQYDHSCLKCDRVFRTYGGMILHLESGSCSDIGCSDLDTLAARFCMWYEFVRAEHRADMLNDVDLDVSLGLYFCPTCITPMAMLSSLFQHIESGSCGQSLDDGPIGIFRTYLAAVV